TIVNVIVADEARRAAERLIAARGWSGITPDQVLDMPSFVIGTADRIADTLEARRERLGLSYYVVSDAALETFAPVVARLSGR
ncbi:MAG: LLM class F420-dependent oxidoreductase, partial [Candidatus Rokubacteria bacterium]|nr:LLM class F420-dependent oxidoreductase [Candidatus Rokubacteria bacterium]